MSRGDLQEMEVGTKQSKTAVNSNAKAGDSMPRMADPGTQLGAVEDLGGPTPENYRSDDDSAKLKTPGATLKQVRDIVNKGAKSADPMKGMKEESEFDEDEELLEAKHKEEEEDEEEEDDEEEMEESFDIEDDVNALLIGEELSEDFKEKAKTIFEAALKSKVNEVRESLEEQYAAALLEEVEEIKEQFQERVDSYLEYVADEWFAENALAIEQGLKTEMTESFLSGMRELFEAHYVSIPEDKYNVLESMVEKLDDMETKLNEQIEKNVFLNKRLAESVADGILDQVSEGLAATQKEKLASLAESVEFESEEEYREKLEMLKESYFPTNKSLRANTESLSEQVDSSSEEISGTMAAYLKTLQAVAKN
jgi:hypothetical protein